MDDTKLKLPAHVLKEDSKVSDSAPANSAAGLDISVQGLVEKDQATQEPSLGTAADSSLDLVLSAAQPMSQGERSYPTFQEGRLTQVILANGNVVKPVNGVYTATTEELFDLLNYYADQDSNLVTPLF